LNVSITAVHGDVADDAGPALSLNSLRKSFGSNLVVDRCDLALRKGEILALLGASGCGKSTLLNMVAGFESPDYGTIVLDGKRIDTLPPNRRDIAMVFQSYAMFPHMTVGDNIAYGLRARRVHRTIVQSRVAEVVQLLKLSGLEARYPAQLSGGQRQRVAVARALAVNPRMLLLDEAFSALDRNLREDMQLELSLLLRKMKITTILVTHDQREAFALADRVAIMEAGRIAQIGTPEEIYRDPTSSYVLRFLGTINRIQGAVSRADGKLQVRLADGVVFSAGTDAIQTPHPPVVWVDIRAEDIAISEAPTCVHSAAPATIVLRTFLGSQERFVLKLEDNQIVVDRASQARRNDKPLGTGDLVYLDFDPSDCRFASLQ
jgi:ABC-type Fe3+/spermidine/putrescine transport system ATPase subunit